MKKPGLDLWIALLALLLIVAMALTLWQGRRGQSRHGYGSVDPAAETERVACAQRAQGPPCRIGKPRFAQA